MSENERIKKLRTTLGLTLEKFGSRLGVGKTAISNIENNKRGITEQMRKAICREFNVNEDWLRYGTGEMFIEKTVDQKLSEFAADLMLDEEDSFRRQFVHAIAQFNNDEWKFLENIVSKLSQKK